MTVRDDDEGIVCRNDKKSPGVRVNGNWHWQQHERISASVVARPSGWESGFDRVPICVL